MRKLPISLGLLVALSVVIGLLWNTPLQRGGEAPPVTVTMTVVDALSARPVAGATVTRLLDSGADLGDPLAVGGRGTLALAVGSPRLVRVEAPGYDARVLGVGPDGPVTLPLTPAASDGVTVRLAGEVMMGRRFYSVRAGGLAPLIGSPEDQAAHDRLLAAVAPVLGDADLTVAGLSSPLVPDPYVGTAGPPAGYRVDKPVVLAGAPATARALTGAGVDVVDLANDHIFDALESGLTSTLGALDDAGLAHFGAGPNAADAWAPAYVDVRDQRVAFVGCTTFGGGRRTVASAATATRAGVAHCSPERLRRAVSAAASSADVVVVRLDSGARAGVAPEAVRLQAQLRALAAIAADAGASVVAGGYAHAIRPIVATGDDVPWIQGTGDLVFDQEAWSSLPSSVTRVSFSGSRARSLTVDPLALVDHRPVPVVGRLADAVSRVASGTRTGPVALGVGTAYWPPVGDLVTERVEGAPGSLGSVGQGWALDAGTPGVLAGKDLLWGTGSMEDLDTDPEATGSTLWALGKYVTTSMEAGCSGVQGLRLRRGPLSAKDVVISPQYRQPVTAGAHLTLTASVRLASRGASLEVRWYRTLDPAKRSSGAQSVAIEPHRLAGPCSPVRLDLVVPEGMVAAQPYIRLSPLHDVNLAAELRVDDVRLIAWSDEGSVGRQLDTLEFSTGTEATVARQDVSVR